MQRPFVSRWYRSTLVSKKVLAFVFGVLSGLSPLQTSAETLRPPIAVKEIVVGERAPELERVLRKAAHQELRGIDLSRLPNGTHYVLSLNLIALERVVSEKSVRSTCIVSAAIRHEKDSTLFAVIRGKATAEEPRTQSKAGEVDALRAAVRSAIRRVPQALERG